jgi:hypothetical protein
LCLQYQMVVEIQSSADQEFSVSPAHHPSSCSSVMNVGTKKIWSC